ncbi:MAG: hypothetical protein LBT63_03025 [Holosporaceae bacterium]|jgi:hypothetical protein|nr:hypothetical protein [Holosporaceae bacterium]
MRVFLLLLLCLFGSISVLEFSFALEKTSVQARKGKRRNSDVDDDYDSSVAARKKKREQEDYDDDDDYDSSVAARKRKREQEDYDDDDREKERIELRVDGLEDFLSRRNYDGNDEDSREKSGKEDGKDQPIIINLDLSGFNKRISGEDDDDDDDDYPDRGDGRIQTGNYGGSTGNSLPNYAQLGAGQTTPIQMPTTFMPNQTSATPSSMPTLMSMANSFLPMPATNQPITAGTHSSANGSPGTISQTTTTISESPQNQQYQQMHGYGMGQNQFANFDPNGAQYQHNQQNYNEGMQNFQPGQANSFGMGGNNYQMTGGGNYYQAGNPSRAVIVREATEEAVRYLRELGAIDESKLSGLTFGDTKSGLCISCKAIKVVHVIGGQDEGICSICLERMRMNQATSGGVFGMHGNAYGGGMQPGGGYVGGNGGYPGSDGRGPMEGLGAVLDGKENLGGLLGGMMGGGNNGQNPYGANSYGNAFGAGANNPAANQMVLDANGNLVPLSSLVGTAAPYGYTRGANGMPVPATSLEAGLSAGSSAIAANAGNPRNAFGGSAPNAGSTTTITTTTTTAAGGQMVLNAAGQLVPLSSLPSGSYGYVKNPTTGQLVPAKTLAEAIAAGQQTAAATTAATAPGVAGAIVGGVTNSLSGALAAGQQASAAGSGFLSQMANAAKSAISGIGTAISPAAAPTAATTPAAAVTPAAVTPAAAAAAAAATPAAATPAAAAATPAAAAAAATPAAAAAAATPAAAAAAATPAAAAAATPAATAATPAAAAAAAATPAAAVANATQQAAQAAQTANQQSQAAGADNNNAASNSASSPSKSGRRKGKKSKR